MVFIPREMSRWYGFDTREMSTWYGFDTRETLRWYGFDTREMLRWYGFGPSWGVWSDWATSWDVGGCVTIFKKYCMVWIPREKLVWFWSLVRSRLLVASLVRSDHTMSRLSLSKPAIALIRWRMLRGVRFLSTAHRYCRRHCCLVKRIQANVGVGWSSELGMVR